MTDIYSLRQFAHDISNKVTVLMGRIHNLKANALEGEIALDVSKVEKAASGLLSMVLDFRAQLKSQDNSLLTLTLMDRIDDYKLLLGKLSDVYGIEVVYSINFDHINAPFYTNTTSFPIVVENIFHNAEKAGATKLIIETSLTDYSLQLHFRDNGCGMTDAMVEGLGMGYTNGGTGQGTNIIIREVMKINGLVTWKSIKDIGTEVTVSLKRDREKIVLTLKDESEQLKKLLATNLE